MLKFIGDWIVGVALDVSKVVAVASKKEGDCYSVQIYWSAGSTGSLALRHSSDGNEFTEVPGSTIALTGAAGKQLWEVNDVKSIGYVQLYFTFTGGSGSVIDGSINIAGEKLLTIRN